MRGCHAKEMPRELEDWLALENEDWSPSYPFPGDVRPAVVDALHVAQRGLCVYCGCRLDMRRAGKSYHIEHFRPQHGFEELSTDFANLFLSCGQETRDGKVAETCGTAKDNGFDEHCHVEPEYPQCTGRFRFLLNGDVAPHAVRDMAAEAMIDLLNLNHPELQKDREELLFAIDAGPFDITDFIDPEGGPAQGYAHVACRHFGTTIP